MGTGQAGQQRYLVQSVARAIELLKAFTQEEPELGLADIARITGLSKPTAFRLLATLQAGGLVSQSARTGSYSLGSEIAVLAAVRARQSDLLDRALPVMRLIRDDLDETTSLAIRVGDHRVHLYQLESLQTVRRTTEIGDRAPLYAGAANRVLLAAMDDGEIAAYLQRTPLVAFTPRTTTDPDKLRAKIRRIRRDGYAESRGERDPAGAAVAAPIRDAAGDVVAVIYVNVPAERYTPRLRSRCVGAVVDGADALSRELGFRPRTTTIGRAKPRGRTT
ncbi:MAG: helix-turn-helix domain-containing protein [Streptosporangiales bacterium]|nr:helix-turn-helix domain-containing protein [Streptosporangiales bacterium]